MNYKRMSFSQFYIIKLNDDIDFFVCVLSIFQFDYVFINELYTFFTEEF